MVLAFGSYLWIVKAPIENVLVPFMVVAGLSLLSGILVTLFLIVSSLVYQVVILHPQRLSWRSAFLESIRLFMKRPGLSVATIFIVYLLIGFLIPEIYLGVLKWIGLTAIVASFLENTFPSIITLPKQLELNLVLAECLMNLGLGFFMVLIVNTLFTRLYLALTQDDTAVSVSD